MHNVLNTADFRKLLVSDICRLQTVDYNCFLSRLQKKIVLPQTAKGPVIIYVEGGGGGGGGKNILERSKFL